MSKVKQLDGNQINWNQVFYFSIVAATGSLKEAALKLDLSPSTLSEHIAQLELDLKIQLFHRSHRKLSLTPEGMKLFQHAKQMFETGQRLIDAVSPVPLGCYPVSIGLVPSYSMSTAYQLIGDFMSGQALLNMRIQHSRPAELENGISESKFDFGFSNQTPERKDIVCQLIHTSTLNFYVSKNLSQKKLSELLKELPLLICNVDLETRSPIEKFLEESDIPPHSVITSDFPSLVVDLCQKEKGIAIFSDNSARVLGSNILKSIRPPVETPLLYDRLYALWPLGGENSAAVVRLKNLLSARRPKTNKT